MAAINVFSVIDLNKIYAPYTGERRRWLTQATGQLAPLRFAPWWTHSFIFRNLP